MEVCVAGASLGKYFCDRACYKNLWMAVKTAENSDHTRRRRAPEKSPTRGGTQASSRAGRSPRPRKARADGRKTRARVLAAAAEVFARDGFEGASLRGIADVAGVDIATLKYHVGNKSDLFSEVYQDGYDHFQQSLGPLLLRIPLAKDPEELVGEVRVLLERGYDYLEQHQSFARLWLYRLLEGPKQVLEAEETLRGNVMTMIEGAVSILRERGLVRDVDVPVFVLTIVTALPTLVLGAEARPEMLGPSSESPRERFVNFFMDVLGSLMLK